MVTAAASADRIMSGRRPGVRIGFLAILVVALAAAWALVPQSSSQITSAIGFGAAALSGLIGLGFSVRAVLRLQGLHRVAWFCVCLLCISATAGVAGAAFSQPAVGSAVEPISLILAVASGAFLVSTHPSSLRLRTVIDALIVAGSVLFVTWSLALRSTTNAEALSAGTILNILALPTIAAVAITLVVRAPSVQRVPLLLLAAAMAWITMAGATNFYQANSFSLGMRLFEIGWVGAFILLAIASSRIPRVARDAVLAPIDTDARSAYLPYFTVGAASIAGAATLIAGVPIDAILGWDGVGLMGLLALRQASALRANRALTSDLRFQTSALRTSEARFRSLVQNSSDAIIVVGNDGVISYVSPAADTVMGAPSKELMGANLLSLVHPDDYRALTDHLDRVRMSKRGWAAIQFRTRDISGKWRDLEATPTNLVDDPDINGIVLNTRDITDRRILEEQLRHQAFHDPLTRLANRALLRNRVQHALTRTHREGGQIALLFIDLDDFKDVNDTLGHGVGDQMLTIIADRIRSSIRDSDTPARLGGDEFAVLLEYEADQQNTKTVAHRIIESVSASVQIDENRLAVGASIGIAFGNPSTSADELLRKADVAMYEAKANGKRSFAIFDNSMDLMVIARLQFEVDMHEALAAEQLIAYYQPIVDINNGRIAGAEALVRWNHPIRGLLPPSEFVGLAEETGQIVAIGREMLRIACRKAHEWNSPNPRAYVSINLSSRHFQSRTLVSDVADALKDSGLDGRMLVVEVTESALLADLHESRRQMDKLRELGVRIALDDFGTGYSSLGYLRELPVDMLKIDRSFVTDLGSGTRPTEFVRAIHTLSSSLSLTTIAEGVEDPRQLSLLQSLGVGYAQGYILSRPVDSAGITKLMKRGRFEVANNQTDTDPEKPRGKRAGASWLLPEVPAGAPDDSR